MAGGGIHLDTDGLSNLVGWVGCEAARMDEAAERACGRLWRVTDAASPVLLPAVEAAAGQLRQRVQKPGAQLVELVGALRGAAVVMIEAEERLAAAALGLVAL